MQQNDTIQIQLSRVIPAEKWRVVRLLTKVWEFPEFVATIKEVSVLEKNIHVTCTRWKVQVEKITATWIEEETFAAHENAISFKAIEGDLAGFRGKWIFEQHPEGTLVTVKAELDVGIPVLKEFAKPYISQLITKNFEAILNGLERRLISIRYQQYKNGDKEKIAGFGIIGHLYNYYHLEKSLKILKPDFKMPSLEFICQLYHLTPSFKLCDIKNFRSKTGETTNGCMIVATFIPDMVERDIWMVYSKVVKACRVAEKNGVGIVALGGFTSIVADKIGHSITEDVDVPVTSGNSFTAAMAIDGVYKASELVGLNLEQAKVAIVGGTGDIGRGCARVLVERVRNLIITGKTKANIKTVCKELARKKRAKVFGTLDNKKAVRDADIVIAVASSSSSILDLNWFKPGAIICDVGYPKNISYTPTTREDILVFSGGLAKLPSPISFPIDIGLPSSDILYGCFSEAIILA
ncbi:MAG: SRPBCC family protein, partial [Candidatus Omnitrophica bacterium]|nr:SRPBCC family protein [Candidatus Omnitrophota bacterium]